MTDPKELAQKLIENVERGLTEYRLMKRWALIVAGLYFLMFAMLTAPMVVLAFAPQIKLPEIAGVYAIIQGRPFHDSVYQRRITGLSIRVYWKDIEPAQGHYRWELFDTVVRRAAESGKKVRLSVMVGHGVPKWVGAKWFRGSPDSIYDTANKEMPLPWDENLRRQQKRMIHAQRWICRKRARLPREERHSTYAEKGKP